MNKALTPFRSFLMGGFECSTHRLKDGRRLDVVNSSCHDQFVDQDYRRLTENGIFVAREGLRWHLIESAPGTYDFSTVRPMLEAAKRYNIQLIWDLFHYGWPDESLELPSPQFIESFAAFAEAFARFHKNESDEELWICPMNEISFMSWAGGEVAYLNPFLSGRGEELKAHLVKASLRAADVVWQVIPTARLIQIAPQLRSSFPG